MNKWCKSDLCHQESGGRGKLSVDLIVFQNYIHLFVKGVYSVFSLKIHLEKTRVGKYIQESICFQLKISFLNITSVAHLLLFNMESDLGEKCDDGFVSL